MLDEQSTRDTLKKLIKYRRERELVKSLFLKLKDTKNKLQEFNDFFWGLIKEAPSFVVKQCYYNFREKASKILNFNDIIKMDDFVIGNYIKSEREHLITSFNGSIRRMGALFKGKLSLTNFRIAGIGTLKRIPLNNKAIIGGWLLGGLVGATIVGISTLDSKQIEESIKWALEREMINTFSNEALSKFDHNFPIISAYNIKKSIKNLSYVIKLNYEHQFGLKAIDFIITPLQEKHEKKNDFYTRRIEILNRIEETLIKTQSLKDYEYKKPPDKLFLLRISKEINENGKEIINNICANCGVKNNFTKTDSNLFHCLKCGARHYIRD